MKSSIIWIVVGIIAISVAYVFSPNKAADEPEFSFGKGSSSSSSGSSSGGGFKFSTQ